MPEVMLRPSWPGGRFTRTVLTKKGKTRRIEFVKGDPVKLSDDEYLSLVGDIGRALFDVERDEKGRPRLLEPATVAASPTPSQAEG